MKQILIFAGTTEGRQLIERLCQYHIQIHACVATEYGKEVLPHSKQITIHAQRMDSAQMEDFLSAHAFVQTAVAAGIFCDHIFSVNLL